MKNEETRNFVLFKCPHCGMERDFYDRSGAKKGWQWFRSEDDLDEHGRATIRCGRCKKDVVLPVAGDLYEMGRQDGRKAVEDRIIRLFGLEHREGVPEGMENMMEGKMECRECYAHFELEAKDLKGVKGFTCPECGQVWRVVPNVIDGHDLGGFRIVKE